MSEQTSFLLPCTTRSSLILGYHPCAWSFKWRLLSLTLLFLLYWLTTVEALVSDHLGNSEKWSQLELVANENGLSKASTWNNRGWSLTKGLFTWREEDPRTRKILWEGKTTFCLVCMQRVCKVKGRTQVHSKCCVTSLEFRHVCFSVHINSIFRAKVVYMVLGSS